jgi:hypothetical protein
MTDWHILVGLLGLLMGAMSLAYWRFQTPQMRQAGRRFRRVIQPESLQKATSDKYYEDLLHPLGAITCMVIGAVLLLIGLLE